MPSTLKVYNASAGSGKTFTLAAQYVALALPSMLEKDERKRACSSFRNILCVTFTNKATIEMKERILQQLRHLAHVGEPDYPHAADRDNFLQAVRKQLHGPRLSDEQIKAAARRLHRAILHDYDHFRVETIDSFFQRLLQCLAHELDQPASYRIELSDKEVISEAVDEMIAHVGDEPNLKRWIINYVQNSFVEEGQWKVAERIKTFSTNLWNETFLRNEVALQEKMQDADFLNHYISRLYALRQESFKHLQEVAQHVEEKISSSAWGYTPISNKHIQKYLERLLQTETQIDGGKVYTPCATFYKQIADAEAMLLVKYKKDAILLEWAQDVGEALTALERERKKTLYIETSVRALRHYFYSLHLLYDVKQRIQQINAEQNRIMLGDTTKLLREMVAESDTPFVMERAGGMFHHVMIDEFQDTSPMQWENFRILVQQGLDSGYSQLVVGDLKQAIFRFRGGDWTILKNLPEEFGSEYIQSETLTQNFRSDASIVAFNNAFFPRFTALLDKALQQKGLAGAMLSSLYADVQQQCVHTDRQGLVAATFATGRWRVEERLHMVEEQMRRLHDEKHYAWGDMLILVRQNTEVQDIVSCFSPDIPLVSPGAYYLKSSRAVQAAIAALRLLYNAHDALAEARLRQETYLPADWKERLEGLRALPLVELCYAVVQRLGIDQHYGTHESLFLYTFLDAVADLADQTPASLHTLLKYWEEQLQNSAIEPAQSAGVRIMTIHTAKGLAAPIVIVPFADIELGKGSDYIWCSPADEAPFNEMPLWPLRPNSTLEHSCFRNGYLQEFAACYADVCNLLYVALTRPKHALLLFAAEPAKSSPEVPSSLGPVIYEAVRQIQTETDLAMTTTQTEAEDAAPTITYTLGELNSKAEGIRLKAEGGTMHNAQCTTGASTLSLQPSTLSLQPSRAAFRPSRQALQFFKTEALRLNEELGVRNEECAQGDKDLTTERSLLTPHSSLLTYNFYSAARRGTFIHRLFSQLRTLDDLPRVLSEIEHLEGLPAGITRAEATEMVRRNIEGASEEVRRWFDGTWKVLNECAVLTAGEEGHTRVRYRPDRVMLADDGEAIVVDFKTGQPAEEYTAQIRGYAQLLRAMGHAPVSAYLWYLDLQRVERVELEST